MSGTRSWAGKLLRRVTGDRLQQEFMIKFESLIDQLNEVVEGKDLLLLRLDADFEQLLKSGIVDPMIGSLKKEMESKLQELAVYEKFLQHQSLSFPEEYTSSFEQLAETLQVASRDYKRGLEKVQVYLDYQFSGVVNFTQTKRKIEKLIKQGRNSPKEADVIHPLIDARSACWELHKANPFVREHPNKLRILENKILEAALHRKVLFVPSDVGEAEAPSKRSISHLSKRKILPFITDFPKSLGLSLIDRFLIWSDTDLWNYTLKIEEVAKDLLAAVCNCRLAKGSDRLTNEEIEALIENKVADLSHVEEELSRKGITRTVSRLENYLIRVQVICETLRAELQLRKREPAALPTAPGSSPFSTLKELERSENPSTRFIVNQLKENSERGFVIALYAYQTLSSENPDCKKLKSLILSEYQKATQELPLMQSWMLKVLLPHFLEQSDLSSLMEIEPIKTSLLREGDRGYLDSPIYMIFSNQILWTLRSYYKDCYYIQPWHKEEASLPSGAIVMGGDGYKGILLLFPAGNGYGFQDSLWYWNCKTNEKVNISKAFSPFHWDYFHYTVEFMNHYFRSDRASRDRLLEVAALDAEVHQALTGFDLDLLIRLPEMLERLDRLRNGMNGSVLNLVNEARASIIQAVSSIYRSESYLLDEEAYKLLRSKWPDTFIEELRAVEFRALDAYPFEGVERVGKWTLYPGEFLPSINAYFHHRVSGLATAPNALVVGRNDNELLLWYNADRRDRDHDLFCSLDLTTHRLIPIARTLEELDPASI